MHPLFLETIFILSDNLSYLEAEYLPYHIKMIPFIFSHLGLLFAYHTTSFFFNASASSSFTQSFGLLQNSPLRFDIQYLSQASQDSFQKSIHLREAALRSVPISIYTFFSRT